MKLELPIYVEQVGSGYHVRPLFFPEATASAEMLSRAMSRLASVVRRTLDAEAAEGRHDRLAACTFVPALATQNVQVAIDAGEATFRGRLLVVMLEALGRRLVHVPAFPEVWFDVERHEAVPTRLTEMLTPWLRRLAQEDALPKAPGRSWITTLDLDLRPPASWTPPEPKSLLALLGGGKMDGAAELAKVGRRLDDLYPDELERAVLREAEVKRLVRALAQSERRPVLVRGPRRVGKTALVHEAVYRREEASTPSRRASSIWLLSPQRLISGMSFVGQWESRLVAILDVARKRGHVLYFDDLLGLFSAGQSASADLSVADVLKPYVERREVRVLGEITPEAFRLLQERDRGLADMFEVVPVEETSFPDTVRIVLDGVRRAEKRHGVRFDPAAIGQVLELPRRYVRDAAFPGKACVFVGQLAARWRDRAIGREQVLHEFHLQSGLSLQMLDVHRRLRREDVVAALSAQVMGQPHALEALADVVSVAKARIADPTRPLASLLFLGPTGVGKTECARALSRFLFGDEARMVRFDMNEFITADAVARLVGTFAEPNGLLTAAVRQAQFCVLLLDEIEKAHPDVFNLLLQVLGDGRLTDAFGRTVDFTQAIVVMTSNLGVREAARPIGLRGDSAQDGLVYRRAAETYFSPELFNRLDRIVPFQRLSRADLAHVARHLLARVLSREGLLRRQVILQIDGRVFETVVDEGYHPVLGARALKRAVERRIAQPIASRLATTASGGATVIALFATPGGASALVHPLRPAQAVEARRAPTEADIEQIEEAVERMSPGARVDSEALEGRHMQYFRLREGVDAARGLLRRIHGAQQPKRALGPPRRRKPAGAARRFLQTVPAGALVDVMDDDLRSGLEKAAAAAPPLESAPDVVDPAALMAALSRDLGLLRALAEGEAEEEAVVWLRGLDADRVARLEALAAAYLDVGMSWLDLDVERLAPRPAEQALVMRGVAAWRLLHGEQGTHLVLQGEHLHPIAVVVQRVPPGTGKAALEALRAGRAQWIEALGRGAASLSEAPHPIGDVVRLYDAEQILDLRTGLLARGGWDGAALREMILGGLA